MKHSSNVQSLVFAYEQILNLHVMLAHVVVSDENETKVYYDMTHVCLQINDMIIKYVYFYSH